MQSSFRFNNKGIGINIKNKIPSICIQDVKKDVSEEVIIDMFFHELYFNCYRLEEVGFEGFVNEYNKNLIGKYYKIENYKLNLLILQEEVGPEKLLESIIMDVQKLKCQIALKSSKLKQININLMLIKTKS